MYTERFKIAGKCNNARDVDRDTLIRYIPSRLTFYSSLEKLNETLKVKVLGACRRAIRHTSAISREFNTVLGVGNCMFDTGNVLFRFRVYILIEFDNIVQHMHIRV